MYKAMYIPTPDQKWEDGCMAINESGEVFTYDAGNYAHLEYQHTFKVAELMIVSMEFNQMRVVGRPPKSVRWLENGKDVIPHTVKITDPIRECPDLHILCPTCGTRHK